MPSGDPGEDQGRRPVAVERQALAELLQSAADAFARGLFREPQLAGDVTDIETTVITQGKRLLEGFGKLLQLGADGGRKFLARGAPLLLLSKRVGQLLDAMPTTWLVERTEAPAVASPISRRPDGWC